MEYEVLKIDKQQLNNKAYYNPLINHCLCNIYI